MLKIDTFICNPIEVNTYLVYDDSKKAVVIDPGFANSHECDVFDDYVLKHDIGIVRCIVTHPHPDHLVGCSHLVDKYNIIPELHHLSEHLYKMSDAWANAIGFDSYKMCNVKYSLDEDSIVNFGNTSLSVIYTPGHAEGSVCFYNEIEKLLFSGDALFRDGIGRTDMPTGNYELLVSSIKNKLFQLPEDVVVYTGHGPKTKIGYEKRTNPFC